MIILKDYYSKKLSAGRLRQVYDLAPDRVRRYLESEIRFVMEKIKPGDIFLVKKSLFILIFPYPLILTENEKPSMISQRGSVFYEPWFVI